VKTSRIYLSPPHVGPDDRALLLDAFDSNWIAPLGPHVDRFEEELARVGGVSSVAALSSGTAALHLALLLLGVGRGDRVIVSTFTFAATANAVMYVGAEPVFIDSEPSTWNMDPELLRDELVASSKSGQLPKAIIVVDLYGQCADYDRILAVAAEFDVPVIEDAAEALGASYRGRPAGSFGVMSTLSFNGNKIITTSGGGALLSNDRAHIDRARYLATQARKPVAHYEHEDVGYNYRLSNLLAALGRAQLRSLDDRVRARRRNFEFYRSAFGDLPGITYMPEPEGYESTRWLSCLLIDPSQCGVDREAIRLALEAENIESRPLWKPMHLQPLFKGARVRGGAFSASLFERGLCLPSGSSLTTPDLERIAQLVREQTRSAVA
jgi:pyridoxal phosphate-dependent aminotransferase EpsN